MPGVEKNSRTSSPGRPPSTRTSASAKESDSASLPSCPSPARSRIVLFIPSAATTYWALDLVAAVQRDLGTVGGLAHTGGEVRAVDPAAEFLEAVEQDLLGDVLRDHERVRILRREPVEPDWHELTIPTADAELPSLDTESR